MGRPRINLINIRFGKLTVVDRVESFVDRCSYKPSRWLCKCDCGTTLIVAQSNLNLLPKSTKSCGCSRGKHQLFSKNSSKYIGRLWCRIIASCYNPNHQDYQNYGGRGIQVCNEWKESIEAFSNWIDTYLGERSEGYSLDRIDNNGNYEPGNIQWATRSQQCRNKRSSPFCIKQVHQYAMDGTYIQTFDSIRQAAASCDRPVSHVRLAKKARSNSQQHDNYLWQIVE